MEQEGNSRVTGNGNITSVFFPIIKQSVRKECGKKQESNSVIYCGEPMVENYVCHFWFGPL